MTPCVTPLMNSSHVRLSMSSRKPTLSPWRKHEATEKDAGLPFAWTCEERAVKTLDRIALRHLLVLLVRVAEDAPAGTGEAGACLARPLGQSLK
jgi:hypothetical protein